MKIKILENPKQVFGLTIIAIFALVGVWIGLEIYGMDGGKNDISENEFNEESGSEIVGARELEYEQDEFVQERLPDDGPPPGFPATPPDPDDLQPTL